MLERIELFDPPAVPSLSGFSFLEFAVDEDSGRALGALLEHLGFRLAARHRSKQVVLYRQGDVNLILNADPDSVARKHFADRGPSSPIGLLTDESVRALNRATALQCVRFDSPRGPKLRSPPYGRGWPPRLFRSANLALRPVRIDFRSSRDAASERRMPVQIDHYRVRLPRASWILGCCSAGRSSA